MLEKLKKYVLRYEPLSSEPVLKPKKRTRIEIKQLGLSTGKVVYVRRGHVGR
jgi:hypothetical protein